MPALFVAIACVDALLTIAIVQGGVFHFVSSSGKGREFWDRMNAAHDASLDLTPKGLNRQVRPEYFTAKSSNTNVVLKTATFQNYETMWNRFEMDFWQNPALLTMSTGPDRLWFASDTMEVTPTDKFFTAFVQKVESSKAPILLVHSPADMRKIRQRDLTSVEDNDVIARIRELSPAQHISADLLRYTPNHLDLELVCPHNGWLLVTDRWAHGWRAKVNGSAAQVFGGDFIFRAVQVHAGANRVEFSYDPFGFPALFILSWTTLAVVLVGPYTKPAYRKTRTVLHVLSSLAPHQ